jgi:superoxide dismutase, Cu-Zn family
MLIRLLALVVPATLLTACVNGMPAQPPGAQPGGTATATAWTVYQGSPSAAPAGSTSLAPGEVGAPSTLATGTFLPYRAGSTAITYDPKVVPPGATARVAITRMPYGMVVRLTLAGLIPRRAYGAHLHTQPCNSAPAAAGPHYQHHPDPVAAVSPPSVNPSYANPLNEVWLDFTADATGAATAVSEQNWTFPAGRAARSLVLHAQPTRTAAGVAGMAGTRVACLTLP